MRSCLEGTSKPYFYLLASACGSGKSTSVQSLIQNWKGRGFPGEGSAIIMLPTLVEIGTYVTRCGLDDGDYACLSPDRDYAKLGQGRGKAGQAKVLFVTHEQARRQMRATGSFAAITDFHFREKPRSLRIWDEGIAVAFPASFRLLKLEALPETVRARNPALADMIHGIRLDNADRKEGHRFTIPIDLGKLALQVASDKGSGVSDSSRRVLEALGYLAGQEVILRRDNREGLMVIGVGPQLPADLAPCIIMDASTPVRHTYKLWAERSKNVIFLPPITADYAKLRLHWWDKGASKSTLAHLSERQKVLGVVADTVNRKPDEEWLVIHAMKQPASDHAPGYCIESELVPMLAAPDKVAFLHWGLHLGRNEFRTIKKVVVIGSLHYGQSAYEAMYAAASGSLTNLDEQGVKSVGRGEFAHNVGQAICRCNVRNIVEGVAGEAEVYLITAGKTDRARVLAKMLPGVSIRDWMPVPPPRPCKEEMVVNAMARLFAGGAIAITVKELYLACGGKSSDYLRHMWDKKSISAFMKVNGITKVGQRLVRYPATKHT